MAEEAKKVEVEVAPPPPTPEPTKDIAEEKAVVPAPEESKALVVVENAEKPAATGGSHERDAFLARVATEKRISLIKAWEESEKAKAENKAAKRLANVSSWENSKIAQMEAELKKKHKKRNRVALVTKQYGYAGATGEEEGGARGEAEEQRGDGAQDGGGDAGRGGGEARRGHHQGGGDGRQVPRQGGGAQEAIRGLQQRIVAAVVFGESPREISTF